MRPVTLAIVIVFAMAVSSCGNGGLLGFPEGYGASNECVDQSDCKNGETCWSPGSCNSGVAPFTCADLQCDEGTFCVGSNSCGGGAFCVADCRMNADACGDTQSCDMDSGRCIAIPCDEPDGITCPEHFECTGGDGNGCTRVECSNDADCAGGTCWASECWGSASYCGFPAP